MILRKKLLFWVFDSVMWGKTALLFVFPTVGSSDRACSNCVVGGVDEGD